MKLLPTSNSPAYENHLFSHKEVNEENNVLKLVSKQKGQETEGGSQECASVREQDWIDQKKISEQIKKVHAIRRDKR